MSYEQSRINHSESAADTATDDEVHGATDGSQHPVSPDALNRDTVDPFEVPLPHTLLRKQEEERMHAQRLAQEKDAMLMRAQHMRETGLRADHAVLMQQLHAYDVPMTRQEHARLEEIHQRAAIAHAALSHTVHEAAGESLEHPALKQSVQDSEEGLRIPALGDQQELHDDAPDESVFDEPRHTLVNFLDGVDAGSQRKVSRRVASMDAARPIQSENMPHNDAERTETFVMEQPTYVFEQPAEPTMDGELLEHEDELLEIEDEGVGPLTDASIVAGHEQDMYADTEEGPSQFEQYRNPEFNVMPVFHDRVTASVAELHAALTAYDDIQNPRSFLKRLLQTEGRIDQARTNLQIAVQSAEQSLRSMHEYFTKRATETDVEACKEMLVSSRELLMMSYRDITDHMWSIDDMESPEYRKLLPVKLEYIHLLEELSSEVQWELLMRDMRARSASLEDQLTGSLQEVLHQVPAEFRSAAVEAPAEELAA